MLHALYSKCNKKKQGDTKHQPGVTSTSRMHTTISPGQLAAMDSCFGPAGPHQHGVANVLGGCLKHPSVVRQLRTTDVLSRVGNSTAVLPLQACGKVDQQKRPVCHIIFKYTCTKSKVTQAPTQLVFVHVSPFFFFLLYLE